MQAYVSDRQGWRRILDHFVWSASINAAVAFGLTFITVLFSGGASKTQILQRLVGNMVYSQCIGLCCSMFIPLLAQRAWHWPRWRFWPIFIALIICMATSGTLLAVFLLCSLGFLPFSGYWHEFLNSIQLVLIITVLMGVGGFLIGSLSGQLKATTLQLKEQQLESERMQKLAAEARFGNLQSRLQPHFLFNTINSILSLIREDPRGAEQMLERLSRLLRYALDSQEKPTVELGAELRLVRDYLEIERTRFGRRLRFEIDVPADAESHRVPPYALQTLVENAMKYSVATRRDGGNVEIRAHREDGWLNLEVRDDGPGFDRSRMMPGHGLDTLEKRLALQFNGAGRLEVESGGSCIVRLRVPPGGDLK